jgi:hypothetical protein
VQASITAVTTNAVFSRLECMVIVRWVLKVEDERREQG